MYFMTAAARVGVDIPNVNDATACRNDKYCNGLFAGCTNTAAGVTCTPKDDICGPKYVEGWSGKLCERR